MQRRTAHLPLHGGQAPPWLFRRMTRLAGSISQMIVMDTGPAELLRRLSDPLWFQAFGCVLGFDWHSSGLTTVTCGALRQAYLNIGPEMGIHVAGGKGGTSRQTPVQIENIAASIGLPDEARRLIYASKMAAKVDSAAVQDGYDLYHHSFFFDDQLHWCVVQQGMNEQSRYARRYHWLGEKVEDFVNEPHAAVAAQAPADKQLTLNFVARESAPARTATVDVTHIEPAKLLKEIPTSDEPDLFLPAHHAVLPRDINRSHLEKIARVIEANPPQTFEQLLGMQGVGAATLRSLALLADLIYAKPVSRRDPATFSYAHGGKDGYPFPLDRPTYDRNISFLEQMVQKSRIEAVEKDNALRRLQRFVNGADGGQ
jgi:uncharacterized protein